MRKKRNVQKKTNVLNKKAPRKGGFPILKFLYAGIGGSAAVLTASLFAYYQPELSKQMADSALQSAKHLAEQAVPFVNGKDSTEQKLPTEGGADSGSGADSRVGANSDSSLNPGGESGSGSDSEGAAMELGNISDLDMEYSPIPSDAIYSSVLDTSMGPMLYYCQGDKRWGDYLYGGADPMKKYGCGPTAVAMLVNSFSPYAGVGITPVDMAQWAVENRQYAPQSGSYHSLIPKALNAWGLPTEGVADRSFEHVTQLLQDGHILVALMGKGALTDNGHFILITGLTANGNVTIADPNRYENCLKEWDLNQLLSELKKSYDSGGPLWVVKGVETN